MSVTKSWRVAYTTGELLFRMRRSADREVCAVGENRVGAQILECSVDVQ
jgi:hypothetical protein